MSGKSAGSANGGGTGARDTTASVMGGMVASGRDISERALLCSGKTPLPCSNRSGWSLGGEASSAFIELLPAGVLWPSLYVGR